MKVVRFNGTVAALSVLALAVWHVNGTVIVIRDAKACFRRAMAGNRVVRGLVRKLLICDTAEQCQRECGDERRFTCEGFNYRLDPTGRGKGECELLDLPLSRIDIPREVLPDPDYDLYIRDRNAAQDNCRQLPRGVGNRDPPEGPYRGANEYDGRRPTEVGRPLRRPDDPWIDDRRPVPPLPEEPAYGTRRGDYSYHHSHDSHSSHSHSYHYNEHNIDKYDYYHQWHDRRRPYTGVHYLPAAPPPDRNPPVHDRFVPPKRRPVIIPLDGPVRPPPPNRPSSEDDYPPWSYGGNYGHRYRGESAGRNYYIPQKPVKPPIPEHWGQYGGSYGTGRPALEYHGYGNRETYNYWGFNKFQQDERAQLYGTGVLAPPPRGGYLPVERPDPSYLPLPPSYDDDNGVLPPEPRRRPSSGSDFYKDECSLRSAAGFKLHKGIVKKYLFVPNIYECELLCVQEKDFRCESFAFKYAFQPAILTENCYLSNRNYKELDHYTDLEPNRDFDVYTMNNRHRCREPGSVIGRDDSECFWRVRSGQRLDHSVIRDSLTVQSIVECQLECLRSRAFTCRAYSFRYGSPVIGGAIDNCQLTDWPFYDLKPKTHFVPEHGFEVYERGSFGHGCEPDHFALGGGRPPGRDPVAKDPDKLCYIGFGTAARLLPQATVKAVYTPTELDCKIQCSKARGHARFGCMSFSFATGGSKVGHNCFLSDVLQTDLLPNVDYVPDPDSWLFTWDNFNPECSDLACGPANDDAPGREVQDGYRPDHTKALDVWRVYSVSGWPCRRGSLCKQNREAGFWYCELEGGDKNDWDYCCSPDHRCGLSNGYSYSWCYVGPAKTQWRKCNEQYYPYMHNVLDHRYDDGGGGGGPPPPQHSPGFRPDRPNGPTRPSAVAALTLDQYEQQFDEEFLGPPKPGGFGQPRRWPVAYLHKEAPPNVTAAESRPSRAEKAAPDSKLSAIKSLIDVIQNTEIRNVQYHIANDSNNPDDVLYVKIPLPNLQDDEAKQSNEFSSNTSVSLRAVERDQQRRSRTGKSLIRVDDGGNLTANEPFQEASKYRRGFVTRTNYTRHSRSKSDMKLSH